MRHRLGPGLVALASSVLLGGCGATGSVLPATTASSDPSGLRICALTSLPAEASDVVKRIHAGGPFRYPRNDGVVFGNRERVLPAASSGYYHEYTVTTPGAGSRGTRRIVIGGTPLTDPPRYYYTGDHYTSFCQVSGADG